jgi:hypothetical protein
VVAFVVLVNRPAKMNARLLKKSKTAARGKYVLATGRNARRLRVGRVKPGLYRLLLKVAAGGETQVLTKKRLRVRR